MPSPDFASVMTPLSIIPPRAPGIRPGGLRGIRPGIRGAGGPAGLASFLVLLLGSAGPVRAAGAGGTSGGAPGAFEGTPGGAKPKGTGAKPTSSRPGGKSPGAAAGSKPLAEEKDLPPSVPPASSSPMAELKKSNDALNKLLKKKYPAWSPEAEAQKADVRKLVGGFLDYRELARRSLAKHWEGLTPAQRQEFVATLRELVENSYLKEVTGDPSYVMKYDKEDKTGADGTEATVDATLSTVSRNKKVQIALVYKLVHKDHWLVYDVVTDEQSMLENYRAEFNKIINKDGFETLLKKMKKKLEEKDD
jgi:phospholipid transport system substrate-binding protein